MRSIRCTDKAVGCNSYTKIKILKPENDNGIKSSLFDGLNIKYGLKFAHCSYFFLASSGLGKISLQLASMSCIHFFLRGHRNKSYNLIGS